MKKNIIFISIFCIFLSGCVEGQSEQWNNVKQSVTSTVSNHLSNIITCSVTDLISPDILMESIQKYFATEHSLKIECRVSNNGFYLLFADKVVCTINMDSQSKIIYISNGTDGGKPYEIHLTDYLSAIDVITDLGSIIFSQIIQ